MAGLGKPIESYCNSMEGFRIGLGLKKIIQDV